MNNFLSDHNVRNGTIGGSLLAFLLNVQAMYLTETIITAATGTVVSFVLSILCKYCWGRIKAIRQKTIK